MKFIIRLPLPSAASALLLATLASGLAQPVIVTQPKDQTNLVGSAASFLVAADGSPPFSYQWSFGTSPASLNGATNATLLITNVQVANQGPYQVVITNVQGAVTSLVANLYVTPPATLQFAASNYTTNESAGAIAVLVQRSGDTNLAVSIDYATSDGTASNGVKYTGVSGPLTFEPGETNKTIVVPVLNEGFVEGTKFFRVNLSNPSVGAARGPRSTTTVNIIDNDFGMQFQLAAYSVSEDAGQVLVWVVRGDDGSLPVTVGFNTSDGSATNGLDYAAVSKTISFAAQERLKSVPISILNNGQKQPSRSFRVTLANPVGVTLGAQNTAIVTIANSNQGFQFGSTNYTVAKDAGAARIAVLRGTADTNSTVTVDFATSDGNATNGVAYMATNGTLFFSPGEKVKLFNVSILNSGFKEATRSFRVKLSNPSSGAALGAPTSSTVSILDTDPGVGFEWPTYTNAWGQGADFGVTVVRGNDWFLGPFTVDYTTANATATAGLDYEAVSGSLRFEQNETVKIISIPILRNRAAPGAKSFRVLLSNPTGGATLGLPSTTVSIVGSYATVAPEYDTALTIHQEGRLSVLTWSGGGQLQRADLANGPWQTITGSSNFYTVQSPIPTTFYRTGKPRPVNVYVPTAYDAQKAMPLVILLHAYSQSGQNQEAYMQFQALAESRGFLYCYPDSAIDQWGYEFWNATDSCCDFNGVGIDDAGFLRNLIQEISNSFKVDPKRVYLIGWSNGSFMAYRMACQSADVIAGIASLAGMTFLDPSGCQPSQPVNILHIHGTADQIVFYAGGAIAETNPAFPFPGNLPAFPGALRDIRIWAAYNGASDPVTDAAPSLDLTTDVAGLETVVTRYTTTQPGGAVELWTINGGTHAPTLSSDFSPRVIDWLLAHPKP